MAEDLSFLRSALGESGFEEAAAQADRLTVDELLALASTTTGGITPPTRDHPVPPGPPPGVDA